MQFTYTYLKNAADRGVKLGTWKNYDVYATHSSSSDLDKYHNIMLVLYDDHNYLYCDGLIYGTLDKNGNIDEWNVPKRYALVLTQDMKKVPEKVPEKPKEEPKEEPSVIGDVELGLLVDKTLSDVETMSIDDLLKGFNYGLA